MCYTRNVLLHGACWKHTFDVLKHQVQTCGKTEYTVIQYNNTIHYIIHYELWVRKWMEIALMCFDEQYDERIFPCLTIKKVTFCHFWLYNGESPAPNKQLLCSSTTLQCKNRKKKKTFYLDQVVTFLDRRREIVMPNTQWWIAQPLIQNISTINFDLKI